MKVARSLNIVVFHGFVKATMLGPAFNANTSYVNRVLSSFRSEFIEKGERVDVLVLHAYPSTGSIPGYVKGWEEARERIRSRAMMLNPRTASHSSPLHLVLSRARDFNVNIVYGPVYEVAGPRYYVTTMMATPEGEIVKYRRACLTRREKKLGLTPGKAPVAFTIERDGEVVGRIGVFSDEDLACPELFRAYRAMGVDVIVGHAMPQPDASIPVVRSGGSVTLDPCILDKLLTVRSMDAGVPAVLVGGVLNIYAGGGRVVEKHWAPTVVVDPEGPGRNSCFTVEGPSSPEDPRPFMGVDAVGRFKRIVVEPSDGPMVDDPVDFNCSRELGRLFKEFCNRRRRG